MKDQLSDKRQPAAMTMSTTNQATELAKILEEDIALGRLHPRERLVEEELMNRFDAKKHIVRSALAELERMGLVVRIPHRGALVKDITPADVDHIYFLRELLERAAVSQIPLPPPSSLISALEKIQQRHDQAVNGQKLTEVFRLNNLFHETLFRGCGNSYLADAIIDAQQKAHSVRSYAISDPKLLERVRKDHWAIINALRNGDRARLAEICSSHLKPSQQAYKEDYFRRFNSDKV